MQSVALIDYGSGNLRSAEKALRKAAEGMTTPADIVVTADPDVVARADGVVLPGVGAFAACMAALSSREGLIEAMGEAALTRGVPFLGICVGMQLLAGRGLEFGVTPGLGWIGGQVARLTPSDPAAKIPHMGWNPLTAVRDIPLMAGLGPAPHMYFTHSFAFTPDDPSHVAASVDHGGLFAAAVAKGNIMGVQFHPEKSQGSGLRLLQNFLETRA
ncbi:MAG: imidazole glycerol phosphate synthase subunit HisH [Caulobacter sp.]|nr:imidazole glycerol phosphate synthase subunit HisH [Caulobacter sp.]